MWKARLVLEARQLIDLMIRPCQYLVIRDPGMCPRLLCVRDYGFALL